MINKRDKEKTAFSLNGFKFEFNRMPFGLKNSGNIFQRAIDDIIRPFLGKFAYVYIDDLIIFSNTIEEHIEHIIKVITALTEANMKLSSEKSEFYEVKIKFLGHYISENKISVDPEKVAKKLYFATNTKIIAKFFGPFIYQELCRNCKTFKYFLPK